MFDIEVIQFDFVLCVDSFFFRLLTFEMNLFNHRLHHNSNITSLSTSSDTTKSSHLTQMDLRLFFASLNLFFQSLDFFFDTCQLTGQLLQNELRVRIYHNLFDSVYELVFWTWWVLKVFWDTMYLFISCQVTNFFLQIGNFLFLGNNTLLDFLFLIDFYCDLIQYFDASLNILTTKRCKCSECEEWPKLTTCSVKKHKDDLHVQYWPTNPFAIVIHVVSFHKSREFPFQFRVIFLFRRLSTNKQKLSMWHL